MSDEPCGIYRKFEIVRTDGSSEAGGKHETCSYFVLDLQHDQFAVSALKAYAKACRKTHPDLAVDIDAIIEADRPRCNCREASCPHVSIWMPNDASEMASYLMDKDEK